MVDFSVLYLILHDHLIIQGLDATNKNSSPEKVQEGMILP